MARFKNLLKYKLKNSQHFDFVEAFIAACRAKGFTASKIVTLLGLLETALGDENDLFMTARASLNVAERKRWDRVRDDRYARLHRLVNVWEGSGIADLDDAATALKAVFDLYKLNTRAQLNDESGVMTNLAHDLSTEAMLARIATIGGSQLYQEMVEANDEVKSFRLAEGTEKSQKVMAALEKARKATDEAYDNLCEAIEGGAAFADDPTPYVAFINEWNGTIQIYQDMLDRKSGTSSSGGASNSDTPGTTDNPGTGDDPGAGDNPGTGDDPGAGDNPSTPDTPTEPGGGGDDPDNGME